MSEKTEYDFIVVGAGSAGCAAAAGLIENQAGSILVLEAGPSDKWPLVRMPFALIWMMGSKSRDWRYNTVGMQGINGRALAVPRGKMIGGSGSINSMVWYRGCQSDFDDWNTPGWGWDQVGPAFEAVEDKIAPARMETPHPLTRSLGYLFDNDPDADVTPERESSGPCRFNMHQGRRWSAANAFLRPALTKGGSVVQKTNVHRILFKGDRANKVELSDGTILTARKGIVLSAGAIGSPEILLRSGVGPADDLRSAGQQVVRDVPGVGENLHDHPGCGIHYSGPNSGYGINTRDALNWITSPLNWAVRGRGVLASPTCEGGLFFDSTGTGQRPDIQSHFIPFYLDWKGRRYVAGSGYFADAVVCRPKSRGRLAITRDGLAIDFGLFNDPDDLDRLTRGWMRLRDIMADADLSPHSAPEAFPGASVQSEDQVRAYIRDRAATAYHPVGTLRMGTDEEAPVTERLKFRGVEGLWVADASIMPSITSANTNAPSMMIGHRAGQIISEDAA